jgi:hypothetical protein
MFTDPSPTGFAAARPHERAPHPLMMFPALLATVSLVLSIAAVLTAVSMSAARATQLF